MSNRTLLDSTHMLNETKDDTEVTLNVISDLLDDIEQDLETITVRKATRTRITSRLEALRDQHHIAIAGLDEIEVLFWTLHDVDSQLSNINQLTSSQQHSRKKHITSVLEDIALLLDDALAGILYGSEIRILEGDDRVNLVNSGQIFVPPTPGPGSIQIVVEAEEEEAEEAEEAEYFPLAPAFMGATWVVEYSPSRGSRSTSPSISLAAAHRGEPTRQAATDEWISESPGSRRPSPSRYRERHRRSHSPTPSERFFRRQSRFLDSAGNVGIESQADRRSYSPFPDRGETRPRLRRRSLQASRRSRLPSPSPLPDLWGEQYGADEHHRNPPRSRSRSPLDVHRLPARAPPPMVDTADARASSMSLATSTHHTASLPAAGTFKAGVPGALRGVTQFTIEELCEEIRSTPELSNAPIGDLYRREIPSGVQHEFILVRSVPQDRPSVWIRIDRAAKRERWQITSRYPADDTGRIAQNGDHRLMAGKSRLRAHVVFKYEAIRPRFLTLADLVTILHEESQDYKLLSENCYFFTSVIQELLTDLHGGELVSGALGHKKLGPTVRQRVRKRFAGGGTPPRAPAPPGSGAAPREPIGKAMLVPGPSRRSRGIINFLSRIPS